MESAKEDEFEMDYLSTPTGTSFSQLLFGDDDETELVLGGVGGVDHQSYNNNLSHSPVFSNYKTPKMLCFGNYQNETGDLWYPETNSTPQKSVLTSSDSSSASSCNHSTTSFNSVSNSNNLQKRRNGSGQQPPVPVTPNAAGFAGQRLPKKTKAAENPISTGHAKRKEKLGERIAALQELVSPFGKTDTASVLHEAMGYIRFLHDQVQVLCSPYLQRMPSSHQPGDGDHYGEEDDHKDLRSRGLCLIPMECTVHVASTNGADFWSPAKIGNNVSPSTTKQ